MSDTPRTDEVMRLAHGKIESARACDLEDLARLLERETDEQRMALHHADAWIGEVPHSDNCYVSDEYPGNECICGKTSVQDSILDALVCQPRERPDATQALHEIERLLWEFMGQMNLGGELAPQLVADAHNIAATALTPVAVTKTVVKESLITAEHEEHLVRAIRTMADNINDKGSR